ncbi:MmcQ/YjbR family DNA-binding protein [Bizionia gelidisalsuginis]|uniref:MmcQ/YjbR family DNA-binding protein n=2 Tax=Bizionia TaxID=283785 RepID=A0A8H2LEY4_9FLAO|nr:MULTISPECIES: MmcQ/YjbR family DNA-binding protein [Bizionia]TYB78174.1 MmcQ/YjbR family DNA-binding protein [Bizionia saleffrena]TYC10599.1 MmcQ/YjbR family DNA-binding protein [Bizionia gelidisalsuginis]
MNIEDIRRYCLEKPQVTEHFPFDASTLVFKVAGKMFLLTSLETWEKGAPFLNLKCNPDYAETLRADYESITPGYHMSKKHWNSVSLNNNDLQPQFIFELIDNSYDLILRGLTKKVRHEFGL